MVDKATIADTESCMVNIIPGGEISADLSGITAIWAILSRCFQCLPIPEYPASIRCKLDLVDISDPRTIG